MKMLNSYAAGDSGKVSVRRSAFSQTCALLGQFVKEKKAFGDLSFQMNGGSNNEFRRTTMNLFPVNDKAEEANSTAIKRDCEIKSAPLTIFYAGQVIVFNDFPADKAKEIMELANPNVTTSVVVFNDNNNDSNNDRPTTKSVLDLTALSPPTPRLNVHPTSLCNTHQMEKPAQIPIPPIFDGDLPMVRKASLHRFLGKRRDRIAAKAPYSTSKPGDVPLKSKPTESDSWLGLGAVSPVAEVPELHFNPDVNL